MSTNPSQATKKAPFQTQVRIKFREGDPAQIMYFANIFSLAHDAFEEFIVAAGYKWEEWFKTDLYMIPIRFTEADFKIPFKPGQEYQIEVSVESFSTSSFVMKYLFSSPLGLHAQVKMVHSCLDQKTKQKIPVPALMRERLEAYLE